MWISFEHPSWLILLVVIAPIWFMAFHGLDFLVSTRAMVTACVRCLVIVLLVAALSQPSLVETSDGISVVVVADSSRSIPTDTRAAAQAWLQDRAANRSSARDRVGVVTFAKNAEIANKPDALSKINIMSHADDSTASDLSAGVRMAMALMPRDTRNRIVLLSDGNETSGNIVEAAMLARSAGVAIDVVPLQVSLSNDIMVESLRAPTRARRGQSVDAKMIIRAQKPIDGQIRFEIDGEAVDLDPKNSSNAMAVHLDAGPNVITIPVALPRSGVVRMKAIFEPLDPAADAIAENNIASALTFVSGEGRILIVDDSGAETQTFAQALRASQLDVQVSNATVLSDPTVAGSYDAIVLANIARWSLDQAADRALEVAVHDLGVGLFMIGGDHSFGAGGWTDSETAKALPVEMNPPQERQLPRGALGLIIDCSGSMGSPVSGSNMDQQQCANEAAIAGIRTLTAGDQVTVIAFDDSAAVVVPLTNVENPEAIAKQVRRIVPRGGTNLFPAIDLAAKELEGSKQSVKHIVILTDGQTMGDPADGIRMVQMLARKGISVSTVSIGDSTNDPLLVDLAKVGGGRCYPVKSQNAQLVLPQIFIKEATVLNRSLLAEGSFAPSAGGQSPLGIPISKSMPQLAGYVITGPRGGLAQNALVFASKDNADPLFSWWNYGVGRCAVFTSDLSSRWGSSWITWSGYQPWCAGLARWLLRQSAPMDTSLNTQLDGDNAIVELSIRENARGNSATTVATAKVLAPDGSMSTLPLRQIAPGRWSATFPTDASGAYLVNAALQQGESERPVFVQAAVNVSYPREFKFQRQDLAKLQLVAQSSGGRVLQLGDTNVTLFEAGGTLAAQSMRQVWDILLYAATLLFIVDVAARRLVFQKRAAGAGNKVVVGQVAQAWKKARQRAAQDMQHVGAAAVLVTASANGGAKKARATSNIDMNSPQALDNEVENSGKAAGVELEVPLDQLPPLERLREAKRRARAADASGHQEPLP